MACGPHPTRPIPAMGDRHRRNFWDKVILTRDCWYWTGGTTGHRTHPYGRFRIGAHLYVAHRIAYTLTHGDIPADRVLDHLCGTPLCVRPDHLRVVTQGENIAAGRRWSA